MTSYRLLAYGDEKLRFLKKLNTIIKFLQVNTKRLDRRLNCEHKIARVSVCSCGHCLIVS